MSLGKSLINEVLQHGVQEETPSPDGPLLISLSTSKSFSSEFGPKFIETFFRERYESYLFIYPPFISGLNALFRPAILSYPSECCIPRSGKVGY